MTSSRDGDPTLVSADARHEGFHVRSRFAAVPSDAARANWLRLRVILPSMSRMAIPVLPSLAVGLLAFSPTASVNCCKLDWPGLLCCSPSLASLLAVFESSVDAAEFRHTHTAEIQAVLGPGFMLHDDNAGHFPNAPARQRDAAPTRHHPVGQSLRRPSEEGAACQLMEAGYRVSTGRSVFFIWRDDRLCW